MPPQCYQLQGSMGQALSARLAGCTSRAMRSLICCVALGGVRDSSATQLGSAPGPRELQSWTSSVSPVSACSKRGVSIAASKDTPRSLERAQAARCVSRWQGNTELKLWRLRVPGRKCVVQQTDICMHPRCPAQTGSAGYICLASHLRTGWN